jgi:hypothetical protein
MNNIRANKKVTASEEGGDCQTSNDASSVETHISHTTAATLPCQTYVQANLKQTVRDVVRQEAIIEAHGHISACWAHVMGAARVAVDHTYTTSVTMSGMMNWSGLDRGGCSKGSWLPLHQTVRDR